MFSFDISALVNQKGYLDYSEEALAIMIELCPVQTSTLLCMKTTKEYSEDEIHTKK